MKKFKTEVEVSLLINKVSSFDPSPGVLNRKVEIEVWVYVNDVYIVSIKATSRVTKESGQIVNGWTLGKYESSMNRTVLSFDFPTLKKHNLPYR